MANAELASDSRSTYLRDETNRLEVMSTDSD